MNTYNDNLRNNVIATLNTMELELKTMQSQANAAMFSYYYALGASINESEQLLVDKNEMNFREEVKNQAVAVANVSNNNLNSASQAGQFVKQSVNNISVGANNVQVAANAVLQLAGDIGDFLNMATASYSNADFHSLAVSVNDYIAATAYDAELASQLAMEASMYTSKVSAPTVLSNAKGTNTAVNKLLNTVVGDYTAIAQKVSADQVALATLSAKEHLAGGVYADCLKENKAAMQGYVEANQQVNLALSVSTSPAQSPTVFTVAFNFFKSPFPEKPAKNEKTGTYPVQDYYIFVVKEEKQFTFSNSIAETIIDQQLSSLYIDLAADLNGGSLYASGFKKSFNLNEISVKDTDGDSIVPGSKYVVFLMAKFWEDYKIKLNTFDNFLSAPSAAFYFTTLMPESIIAPYEMPETGVSALQFQITQSDDFMAAANPSYRVSFLPMSAGTSGMAAHYNSLFLYDKILFAERASKEINDSSLEVYKSKLIVESSVNEAAIAFITWIKQNAWPVWSLISSEALQLYKKDKFGVSTYPILEDTPAWLANNSKGKDIDTWIATANKAVTGFNNDQVAFFTTPEDPQDTLVNEKVTEWLNKIKNEPNSPDGSAIPPGVLFKMVYLMAFIEAGERVSAMLEKNMSVISDNKEYYNGILVCDTILAAEANSHESINNSLQTYNTELANQQTSQPGNLNIINWLKENAAPLWATISNAALQHHGKDRFNAGRYPILAGTPEWLHSNTEHIKSWVKIANEAIADFSVDAKDFFSGQVTDSTLTGISATVAPWIEMIKKAGAGAPDVSAADVNDFFNLVYITAYVEAGQKVLAMLETNQQLLQSFMKTASLQSFVQSSLQNFIRQQVANFTGFEFNAALAQQVSSANYTEAETSGAPASQNASSAEQLFTYGCTVNDATTDNFGTVLLPEIYYIPAVLSVADIEEENPSAPSYTSVLCFALAGRFIPSPTNSIS